jgi:hypothetical protein
MLLGIDIHSTQSGGTIAAVTPFRSLIVPVVVMALVALSMLLGRLARGASARPGPRMVQKACRKCGWMHAYFARFCPHCGRRV